MHKYESEMRLINSGATAYKFDLSDALLELSKQVKTVECERDFWLERIMQSINGQIPAGERISLVRERKPPVRYWLLFSYKNEERFSRFLLRFMSYGGDFEGFFERWHGCFQLDPLKLALKTSYGEEEKITEVVKEHFERMGFEVTVNVNEDN